MSDTIIYPSIDLFLYDLKDGLGQDEEQINDNCYHFCKKIYANLDENTFQEKYAQIQKHKNSNADIIELLDIRIQPFSPPLDGWYYPLQLNDTYALQVNYSGKLDPNNKYNDHPQEINNQPFLTLKQEILQKISQQSGTIGQTWLLWGKLTDPKSDTEIDKIAQTCYTQILNNYDWQRDFIGKGSLGGATLFELWYQPENLGLTGKEFWDKFRAESYHILIWLFPHNQTPDEMRKQVQTLYYDFLRLFHYRHKIVWSYYQSRYQKSLLKNEYIEIQPAIHRIRELTQPGKPNRLNLNQLQKTLNDHLINLSDYALALHGLENQSRTIEVNLANYQDRTTAMINKYSGSDLQLLEVFSSEIYAQKYQRQVESDCKNFQPGLTLLENLNNTIQGIIDIERTKSDRALDDTIAIAGIGLAISGITATAISVQNPPPTSYKDISDISFFTSPVFVWSIGFSAPFLILLFCRLIGRFFRR